MNDTANRPKPPMGKYHYLVLGMLALLIGTLGFGCWIGWQLMEGVDSLVNLLRGKRP